MTSFRPETYMVDGDIQSLEWRVTLFRWLSPQRKTRLVYRSPWVHHSKLLTTPVHTDWRVQTFITHATLHDDVIKWKHFPRYWSLARGIYRPPVNSPHKGQWRGALMFSLICVWINGWVNNREAGDLKRYRGHCDVIVMRDPQICYSMFWDMWPVLVIIFLLITCRCV